MKTLTFMFCVMAVTCACAQSGLSPSPKVIPPSPNASAFQRYGEMPVGAYTGSANISVPLYTVQSGEIAVPLSVNYNTSGIKVNEEASKVGLGWSLSAGGMISRTIMGSDDFYSGDGLELYHNAAVPALDTSLIGYASSLMTVQLGCEISINTHVVDYLNYDSEPDQYFFSLPNGQSGKFILTRNKKIILEKDELIEIKLIDPVNATKWQILTPDGFKYDFEDYESNIDGALKKTAWYISKITSPSNEVVTFKYHDLLTSIETVGGVSQQRDDGPIQGTSCSFSPFVEGTIPGRLYVNRQLDSIKFNGGAVGFSYSARQDIAGDVKVDSIVVARKTGSVYEVVKRFKFQYDYFTGTSDTREGEPTGYQSKRLKLKAICTKVKANKTESYYRFDYNNETELLGSLLPSKLSFARDHWGYYNGRQNSSLIPSTTSISHSNWLLAAIGRLGPEREPNPQFTDLFALKRITYPTGGYTVLELESHQYDEKKSVINENAPYSDVASSQSASMSLDYSGSVHTAFPSTFAEALSAGKVIDLSDAYLSDVYLTAYFRFNQTRTDASFSLEETTFQLIAENGMVYGDANIFQALAGPNAKLSGYPGDQNYPPAWDGILYTNAYTNLPPGRYYWKLYIASNVDFFADVHPTFTYYKAVGSGLVDTRSGGGLRVKRTFTYESANAAPKITRYDYTYWEDVNSDGIPEKRSSGRRMVRPTYHYVEAEAGTAPGANCHILKRTSECLLPLAGNGSPVSYDRVTVYHGENGEYGKTHYEYFNAPDFLMNYYFQGDQLPRKPPSNGSIRHPFNGLLKAQYDFRYNAPNVFDTVRTVVNTYQGSHYTPFDYNTSPNSVIWACEKRAVNFSEGTTCSHHHRYLYPAINRSRIQLVSSKERIYDQGSQTTARTSVTNNTYSSTHYQLTAQEKVADGKKFTTRYKYLLDYANAQLTPAMLAMRVQRYSPVIQTRSEQTEGATTTVTGQVVSTYNYAGGGTSMILPQAQAVFMQSSPLTPLSVPDFNPANVIDTVLYKIGYHLTYNSTGNIESIKTAGEKKGAAYLWNNVEAPIAEIKNALAAECAFTSFEGATGEGNWTFTATPTAGTSKTGKKYIALSSSVTVSKTVMKGTYYLEYYAKAPLTLTSVAGLTVTDVATSAADVNGWISYKKELSVTNSSVVLTVKTSGATVHADEFRLYPVQAQMTSYTYEPLIGMTNATDPNGRTLYYEYDDFSRLKVIRDDNRNILKTFQYRLIEQQQ